MPHPLHATPTLQIAEKAQQMLHVKSEDMRLYDITADENSPKLLEDETVSIRDLGFSNGLKPAPKEGFKLLIESMCHCVCACVCMCVHMCMCVCMCVHVCVTHANT